MPINGRMDFGKNGIRMWYNNASFGSTTFPYAFINIDSGTNTTKLNMGKQSWRYRKSRGNNKNINT